MDTRERNRPKYLEITPHEIEVNGQPALYFGDRQLQIMSKEEFLEMLELAERFYGTQGIEEWIKKENAIRRWREHPILGTEMINGKYILPELLVEKREFRKNLKKNWSFVCPWCNIKVSSKTGTQYFRINERIEKETYIEGNCCSKACAENLWYELLIEWVLDRKLTDIFHTDKHVR